MLANRISGCHEIELEGRSISTIDFMAELSLGRYGGVEIDRIILTGAVLRAGKNGGQRWHRQPMYLNAKSPGEAGEWFHRIADQLRRDHADLLAERSIEMASEARDEAHAYARGMEV